MTLRRGLLVAILAYVTLDLSAAMVPGAFVFDPADSVESVQVNRGRGTADIVAFATPADDSFVISRPHADVTDRSAPTRRAAPLRPGAAMHLPRAALDPAPPSEDH